MSHIFEPFGLARDDAMISFAIIITTKNKSTLCFNDDEYGALCVGLTHHLSSTRHWVARGLRDQECNLGETARRCRRRRRGEGSDVASSSSYFAPSERCLHRKQDPIWGRTLCKRQDGKRATKVTACQERSWESVIFGGCESSHLDLCLCLWLLFAGIKLWRPLMQWPTHTLAIQVVSCVGSGQRACHVLVISHDHRHLLVSSNLN